MDENDDDIKEELIAAIRKRHSQIPIGIYKAAKTENDKDSVQRIDVGGGKVVAVINSGALGPELSRDYAAFYASAYDDIEFLLSELS